MEEGMPTEAWTLFVEIIENSPGTVKELIAELNQAYCYYKLSEQNVRSLPDIATHQPKSYKEYRLIERDIFAQIEKLTSDESENTDPGAALVIPAATALKSNLHWGFFAKKSSQVKELKNMNHNILSSLKNAKIVKVKPLR